MHRHGKELNKLPPPRPSGGRVVFQLLFTAPDQCDQLQECEKVAGDLVLVSGLPRLLRFTQLITTGLSHLNLS